MSYRGIRTPISKRSNDAFNSNWPQDRSCLLNEVRNRSQVDDDSFRTEAIYLYWIGRYIHANDRRYQHEFDGAAERFFRNLRKINMATGMPASLLNQIDSDKRTKAPSETG